MDEKELINKLHLLYWIVHEEALHSLYNFYKYENEEELLMFISRENKNLYDWILSLYKETRKELMENLYQFYLKVYDVG
jgi:hypothetical protein